MSHDVGDMARRHGFSDDAVSHMLDALLGGGMAQFEHPEFGGSGQWMRGMIMLSGMFNHSLKARVETLGQKLFTLIANRPEAVGASGMPRQGNRERRGIC